MICNMSAILCQSEMSSALALLSCFSAGVTAVPLSFLVWRNSLQKNPEKNKPPFIIMDFGGELHIVDIDCGEYIETQAIDRLPLYVHQVQLDIQKELCSAMRTYLVIYTI